MGGNVNNKSVKQKPPSSLILLPPGEKAKKGGCLRRSTRVNRHPIRLSFMYLSLPLSFFSLKKYVSIHELRGATTTQARIGLLTKGSALLFLYYEPVEPFGDVFYAEG